MIEIHSCTTKRNKKVQNYSFQLSTYLYLLPACTFIFHNKEIISDNSVLISVECKIGRFFEVRVIALL